MNASLEETESLPEWITQNYVSQQVHFETIVEVLQSNSDSTEGTAVNAQPF